MTGLLHLLQYLLVVVRQFLEEGLEVSFMDFDESVLDRSAHHRVCSLG